MGSSEADTSSKSPKKSSAQEEPAVNTSAPAPATPSYPDWSNYHAYSPVPPHGYYPTAVASSPQTHPYMWGPQAMMPPYVMYPPGGIYAHPSMPPGSHPFSPYAMPSSNGNTEAPVIVKETEAKSSEFKEKSLIIKRSKDSLGSLNMISAKLSGAISQSGESGSDSSTEGSDANSQNDSQNKASAGEETFGDTAQNGKQPMAIGQVAAGPSTNLNIGMDNWRSPVETSVNNTLVPANNNTRVPSEQRILNERELKKLKRKQSNRESARRSRLRKQAECEELSVRAESLKQENEALKAEVERIKKEYNELINYNISLKKKIGESNEKEDKSDNEKKP